MAGRVLAGFRTGRALGLINQQGAAMIGSVLVAPGMGGVFGDPVGVAVVDRQLTVVYVYGPRSTRFFVETPGSGSPPEGFGIAIAGTADGFFGAIVLWVETQDNNALASLLARGGAEL